MKITILIVVVTLLLLFLFWRRIKRRRELATQLKNLDSATGLEFESWLTRLLELHPLYRDVHNRQSPGDDGIDLTARRSGKKLAIQAKRYANPVGRSVVMETYAAASYYNMQPVVATQSTFTPAAKKWARRLHVELIDRDRLAKLASEALGEGRLPLPAHTTKEEENVA